MWTNNTNAYAQRACVAYTYSDGDGYTSSESNTYAKLAWLTYAYTHGNGDSSSQGNTKASTDSTPSAVSPDSQ